jgi:hypothetical protein
MIERLTAEQEASLPGFREAWARVGANLEPIDRAASRAAIERLYVVAGLPRPEVLFFDSQRGCAIALDARRGSDKSLRTSLWDVVGASLRASLREDLRAVLHPTLRESLDKLLRGHLVRALSTTITANLRGSLQAKPPQGAEAERPEYTWFWGGQDAPWLAYFEFARLLGVRYRADARLSAYIAYATNSGWMYAYPGLALVADRPEIILTDRRQRLHCETGPAVRFRDGFPLYAWHGRDIPAAWIEDRASLTPEVALAERSSELRRVACEIVGWDVILEGLDARSVDCHPDPEIGELVEVAIGGRPARFLRMTCGTGRRFACNVPFRASDPEAFDIDTAWAAQAWIHGETPETFEQPFRT